MADAQIQQLQALLLQSNDQVSRLGQAVSALQTSVSNAEQQISDLNGKCNFLNAELRQKSEKIEEIQDQLTTNIKQKEELITRLTNLEDNYQKGEMLRE